MVTLALDSSSKPLSLALIRDGRILASYNDLPSEPQSSVIIKVIDSVFKKANVTVDQITDVLFCNGPGSFTSLRVGLATLQGLFLKSGVRFLVTSSLLLRCLSSSDQSDTSDLSDKSDKAFWAKLPLGRDRLAVGLFDHGAQKLLPKHIQSLFKQRVPSCPNYYEGFLSGEHLAEMNQLFPALSSIAPDDISRTDPTAFLTIIEKKWFEETSLAQVRLFYMIEPDVGKKVGESI